MPFNSKIRSIISGIYRAFFSIIFTLGFISCSLSMSDSTEERENLLLLTLANIQSTDGFVISKDGTPIYFKKVGTGTPIVVLHGGPGLDHNYLVSPLSSTIGTGKQLIFFDQRGTGFSGGDVDPSKLNSNFINKEKFLEDLDAIRTQLGLGEKINIIGHSWGGLYAMLYATNETYKNHVKSLALVGSAGSHHLYYTEFVAKLLTKAGGLTAVSTIADLAKPLTPGDNFQPSLSAMKTYYNTVFQYYFSDYVSGQGSQNLAKLNLENSSNKTILNGLVISQLINASLGFTFNSLGIPTNTPAFIADLSKLNSDVKVLLIHGNDDVIPPGFILNTGQNTTLNTVLNTGGTELLMDTFSAQTHLPTGTLSKAVPIAGSGHFPFIEKPTDFAEAFSGFY